jgi:cytidyltransferase-like protein
MIATLDEVSKKVKEQKTNSKKIGLITGCFDILHFGHIELFRFAKKHVDVLVVGLENDKTISLSKGKDRPINALKYRLEFLSELKNIDLIFEIKNTYSFKNKLVLDKVHSNIYKKIKPDYLITAINADESWKRKKRLTKKFNIKIVFHNKDRYSSSTNILNLKPY